MIKSHFDRYWEPSDACPYDALYYELRDIESNDPHQLVEELMNTDDPDLQFRIMEWVSNDDLNVLGEILTDSELWILSDVAGLSVARLATTPWYDAEPIRQMVKQRIQSFVDDAETEYDFLRSLIHVENMLCWAESMEGNFC